MATSHPAGSRERCMLWLSSPVLSSSVLDPTPQNSATNNPVCVEQSGSTLTAIPRDISSRGFQIQ